MLEGGCAVPEQDPSTGLSMRWGGWPDGNGCLNDGCPLAVYFDCFVISGPWWGCCDDDFEGRIAYGAELEVGTEWYVTGDSFD